MKRTLILVFGFFLTLNYLQAQDAKPVSKNGPVITFDQKLRDEAGNIVWDYGTIYKDSNGDSYFRFTNTGKEPLVLSEVRSSCGCTVPRWPREPILPGKSDTIKVRYATNRLGVINKTITVMSNAVNNPVILRIKGNVIEKPAEVVPEKKPVGAAQPLNKAK
ncbi:MAG TPA: DUF1573 domain-containing protein [Bacteroidales bacterium]|jgi:hypothetical protein|nr:DUF1573 domain-containing protein [Bacteroidales bacterium]HQQ02691.1 DUF1573 domain-containing protein [Bacteroidales bacterium]